MKPVLMETNGQGNGIITTSLKGQTMPLPICTTCKQQMVVKKNDVPVKDREHSGFASTIWRGDLFECPKCHIEIISNFGSALIPTTTDNIGDALTFEY